MFWKVLWESLSTVADDPQMIENNELDTIDQCRE